MGYRAGHFILESVNTPQRSGSLRGPSARLTSDATLQFRSSLFQRAMKYPENNYEAMDASMFSQSDRSLTEVAAFGILIFLRSRLGGR